MFPKQNHSTFKPPVSLEEGHRQRQQLTEEIANIASQLGDKNKQHPCEACRSTFPLTAINDPPLCAVCNDKGGTRFTSEEYQSWRKKALTALRARESALRRLNVWIDTQHRGGDAHLLLARASEILQDCVADDIEFTEDELDLIADLKNYITLNGETNARTDHARRSGSAQD